MINFKSVVARIVLCFTIGIFLYSAGILLFINYGQKRGVVATKKQEVANKVNAVSAKMKEYEDTLVNSMAWVKSSYESQYDYIDEMGIDDLCRYSLQYFGVTDICIIDSDGEIISDEMYGELGVDGIVDKILQGQVIDDYYIINGEIYAVYAEPVYFHNKISGGVIGQTLITAPEFVDFIVEFSEMDFAIVDEESILMDGYIDDSLKPISINKEYVSQAYKDENSIIETKYDGIKNLEIYFPIKNNAGGILYAGVLRCSLDTVNAVAKQILIPLSIICVVLSIILLLLMLVVVGRLVVRKLKLVDNAIKELSSGEADLTTRLKGSGGDEFSAVEGHVNDFIVMLQEIILNLYEAQRSLKSIGEDLGLNSQESASATAQIMANIESVRKQTENQANSVNETSDVLQKSNNRVEELVALINDQVAGITESSAAIEEMISNITSVTNAVKKMADNFKVLDGNVEESNVKIENVGKKVAQMAEQSQTLMQANNMIAQVASQTNLLAMNAAIEAAHAGDAGKGFSVVADEIRKLAETSSAQSKNINSELKEITATIQDVVELSKDSQTSFSSIVSQLEVTDGILSQITGAMEEQELASNQVLQALNVMKTQSVNVNDKVMELKHGVVEVKKDMEDVSQITITILGSMDEMASGSKQINSSAQNVSDLAQKTKDNIEILDGLLKKFKA